MPKSKTPQGLYPKNEKDLSDEDQYQILHSHFPYGTLGLLL